jgi:hypothetical protein
MRVHENVKLVHDAKSAISFRKPNFFRIFCLTACQSLPTRRAATQQWKKKILRRSMSEDLNEEKREKKKPNKNQKKTLRHLRAGARIQIDMHFQRGIFSVVHKLGASIISLFEREIKKN